MRIKSIREYLKAMKVRSAWENGIIQYAFDMLDRAEENGYTELTAGDLKKAFFGSVTISESSYGGDWLVSNESICKRLCTPSEYKLRKGGERRPNRNETWFDVQYRALFQADAKIYSIIRQFE